MTFNRLKRMFKYIWPHKYKVLAIMFFGFFFGIVNASLAGLAGFTVRVVGWSEHTGSIFQVVPKQIMDNKLISDWLHAHPAIITQYNLFVLALGLFLLLMLLLATTVYFQNYLPEVFGHRVTMEMRNRLGEHLLNMNFAFFQEKRSGDLLSRLTNDLGQMTASLLLLGIFLTRPFALLVLFIYLFTVNWKLAIWGMIGVPLAGVCLAFLFKKIRRVSRQAQQQAASVTDTMVQFLTGISTVKAYGCEEFELKNFRHENESLFKTVAKCLRSSNAERPVTSFTGKIGMLAVLYIGGIMVMDKTLPVDVLITFGATLSLMYAPAKDLSRANANFQVFLAGAERVFNILETDSNIIEGNKSINDFKDSIEFQDVNFSYTPGNPVIRDFSLEVRKGEMVALIGPSGSGKSTLVHLLLRLYDINNGSIKIDGTDIRELTFDSLRSRIALVSQTPFLFNSTITDNIAYGREDINHEDIIKAAKIANIHDDIMALENGYDTIVGDGGGKLSGGQRQRVSIARAVFKNPEILLLDEATSALDSENEKMVQDALTNLMKGRTSIVIAHRLSTIRHADRIVILENGRINTVGSHQKLIKESPKYAEMVSFQQLNTSGSQSKAEVS